MGRTASSRCRRQGSDQRQGWPTRPAKPGAAELSLASRLALARSSHRCSSVRTLTYGRLCWGIGQFVIRQSRSNRSSMA